MNVLVLAEIAATTTELSQDIGRISLTTEPISPEIAALKTELSKNEDIRGRHSSTGKLKS